MKKLHLNKRTIEVLTSKESVYGGTKSVQIACNPGGPGPIVSGKNTECICIVSNGGTCPTVLNCPTGQSCTCNADTFIAPCVQPDTYAICYKLE